MTGCQDVIYCWEGSLRLTWDTGAGNCVLRIILVVGKLDISPLSPTRNLPWALLLFLFSHIYPKASAMSIIKEECMVVFKWKETLAGDQVGI